MRGIPSVSRTTRYASGCSAAQSGSAGRFLFPRLVQRDRLAEQQLLRLFSHRRRVRRFFKGAEEILLLLEHDLRRVLAASFINASVAGRVVGGALAAAKCFDAGSVDMRQQLRHLRVMTLFLAAAAFHISINQVVVRYVNFSSAVAAAVPDDASTVLCFCWVPRREPEKALSGNVSDRVVFPVVGTARSAAAKKKRSEDGIFRSTGATGTASERRPLSAPGQGRAQSAHRRLFRSDRR